MVNPVSSLLTNVQTSEPKISEAEYQALLLNNIREAVVVWDLGGRITYWNAAAMILFGWSPAERIGQDVRSAYFSIFSPQINPLEGENTSGMETERQCHTRSGNTVWVSGRTTALRETSGNRRIIGYMDLARDINRSKQAQQALKESQVFIQRIVDTSPNLLFIYDINEERCTFMNREVKKVLGFEPEEIINMGSSLLDEVVHPDDRQTLRDHYEQLRYLPDGQVTGVEFRIRTKDGRWRWFYSRDTVFLRSPAGAPYQLLDAAQDITDRKQIEADLKRRVEVEKLTAEVATRLSNQDEDGNYANILSTLDAVSDFLNADFGCLFLFQKHDKRTLTVHSWWNELNKPDQYSSVTFTGVKAKEIVRAFQTIQQARDLPLDEFPVQTGEGLQALRAAGIKSAFIMPLRSNNVHIGLVGLGCLNPERHWNEVDIRFIQTVADIIVNATVNQWAHSALSKSEARYRAIVDDHQTELICRFLPDGTLNFVNETYCRYFGKTREELTGSNFLDAIPPDDQTLIRQRFTSLTRENPVVTYENRVHMPNGELRWQEWTDRAIFDEAGQFLEFQSVGRDVTQRVEMENQLRSATTQLAEQGRLTAIGELAASVAHTINNPLTTIIAESQILKQNLPFSDPAHDSAVAIEQAGWRAQQVVQELMEFSQPTKNTFEPLAINQTIQEASILIGAHIEATGVKLALNLRKELPLVFGNLHQFVSLWVYLLLVIRAANVNTQPHTIDIRSDADDLNSVIVEISDDGMRIPQEELETIFEPRLTPSSLGSGLEMSICREIVRQNHGTISVLSTAAGTTFRVVIPVEE
jgi:PAS domain S-box-containing protein